jgi:hypothetical protein
VSTPPKRNSDPHYGYGCCFLGIVLPALAILGTAAVIWFSYEVATGGPNHPGKPRSFYNPIVRELGKPGAVEPRLGIAAVVLLDTSGSMKDTVRDLDGSSKPKLDIARRAMLQVVQQFDDYARAHPERAVRVGIYEFSGRSGRPACRPVILLSQPSPGTAAGLLEQMVADGNTPIGDAMIEAKHDLDATGFTRQHVLVITDGVNNRGYSPADVTAALAQQPEEYRASVYFIAFDIEAQRFKAEADAGAVVLGASNAQQLQQTLGEILSGKILVEQPEFPRAGTGAAP